MSVSLVLIIPESCEGHSESSVSKKKWHRRCPTKLSTFIPLSLLPHPPPPHTPPPLISEEGASWSLRHRGSLSPPAPCSKNNIHLHFPLRRLLRDELSQQLKFPRFLFLPHASLYGVWAPYVSRC